MNYIVNQAIDTIVQVELSLDKWIEDQCLDNAKITYERACLAVFDSHRAVSSTGESVKSFLGAVESKIAVELKRTAQKYCDEAFRILREQGGVT